MLPFENEAIFPGITFIEPGQAEKTGSSVVNAGDKGIFYSVYFPKELIGEILQSVTFQGQTLTGSPSADLRIETDDPATAKPTGTLAWAGARANFAIGALSAAQTVSLDTPGEITEAGIKHVCFVPPSAGTTPDGSNTYNIITSIANQRPFGASPLIWGQAASGLTTTGGRENFTISSTGTLYTPPMLGFTFQSGKTWSPILGLRATNSSTSGADVGGNTLRGNKITLNFAADIGGIVAYYMDSGSTLVEGLEVRFYEGDATTPFATRSYGRIPHTNSGTTFRLFVPFDSTVRMEANQSYRVMLACAAGSFRLRLGRAFDPAFLPYDGNFHQTRSTDNGATWSDANADFAVLMDLAGTPVAEAVGGGSYSYAFAA
jgi:hypothetical protein